MSQIRIIDELGRIVIPKDVRKKLKIKSSDLLEISTDNNIIIINKYSDIDENFNKIIGIIEVFKKITGNDYTLYNKNDLIYSTSNSKLNLTIKELFEHNFYNELDGNNYFNSNVIIINGIKSGIIVELLNKKSSRTNINLIVGLIEKLINNS